MVFDAKVTPPETWYDDNALANPDLVNDVHAHTGDVVSYRPGRRSGSVVIRVERVVDEQDIAHDDVRVCARR